MNRPGRVVSQPNRGTRPDEAGQSPYVSALASARKVRRRDLALVEQYLAQIRMVASAQARSDARARGSGGHR
jgi:hypothetical protein